MAIMIPSKPLDYDKSSKEDLIFNVLKKYLPDDWYVCHSFKIKDIDRKNQVFETEIDFLILIPDVAAVCLEAKAGAIDCLTGKGLTYNGQDTDYLWVYSDGTVMKYNGPFRQLERSRRNLNKYLREGRVSKFLYGDKIDFLGLVCFPSLDSNAINNWNLPADAGNTKYILSKNDFVDNPNQLTDKILNLINYQIEVEYTNKKDVNGNSYIFNKLNDEECQRFIRHVIAPACNLIPSPRFFIDLQNGRLSSFLKDQTCILDYLEEQNVAVIAGGAGTGKTMIALEKAIRLSECGEKVLYLCYNAKLKEHLEKSYKQYPLITFENIDSLYNHYLNTLDDKNYNLLVKKIDEDKSFDFKHFLVDEAQDYGKKEIEASGFLLWLQLRAEERSGTCYFFYDKYQCVQSKDIPEVIKSADCKLTLFRNCRNTDKIAKSSCTLFTEKEFKKKHIKGFESGNDVKAVAVEKENNYLTLEKLVNYYKSKNYKDIVILTAKDLKESSLSELVKNEKINVGGYLCQFTTCRKFKGLEAEVIILVDIDNKILLDDSDRLLYYVGASRAKFELGIIFNASIDDCKKAMKKFECNLPVLGKSYGTFYMFFGAVDGND